MRVQVLLTTRHSPLSTRSFHVRAGRCVIPDIFNRESIVVPYACGLLAHHSPLVTRHSFVPYACGLRQWIPDYQRRE